MSRVDYGNITPSPGGGPGGTHGAGEPTTLDEMKANAQGLSGNEREAYLISLPPAERTLVQEFLDSMGAGGGAQGGQVGYVDGQFNLNGQTMDLATLVMMLNMDRVQMLDKQIADQSQEMQDRNARLSGLNTLMSELRTRRGTEGEGSSITINGQPEGGQSASKWFEEFGIAWTPINGDSKDARTADWDQNIANIKTKSDSLSNNSQLDMIRLQSVMNKRNQAFEMMSNVTSKMAKLMDSLVANMR